MKSTDAANWILITGTSTGIGRAATFTLAENGYRVLAAVRKQEDVESLLAEAGTRRVVGAVEPIILDVTDAGQIAAAVEIVRAKIAAGGRLHAIVNNAGAQWPGPIETLPLTDWRLQFDVPLSEATTPSLEALSTYAGALKAYNEQGVQAALALDQHAIELDPSFAMAYYDVGDDYFSLNQLGRASQYYTKAFELDVYKRQQHRRPAVRQYAEDCAECGSHRITLRKRAFE